MKKKYYKVLPDDLTRRGFRYQEGLNVDTLPIRPVENGWGNWGLHFVDIDHILGVVRRGTMIADVEIPEDAIMYEFPLALKANRLILKNIRPLWNIEVFKELERQGADIHGKKELLLHAATEVGSLDMVKYFAEEEGADVHGLYNGHTVVMRAAEKGHLDVVKYLTGQGVDIHTYMETPLCLAAKNGHLEVVKHLAEQGADIGKYKNLLLFEAAENGRLNVVKYMVEYGCHLDHSALGIAAENGHLDVVKFLAEQGVDIHAEDEFALRRAAEHDDSLDVVKYLVEQGADIHVHNEAALCYAAAEGALNVVKYLVEQGADIHARNDYPLRVAKAERYQSMVEYLMRCL